ncbi:MAG: ankyrin repeat domain-containing protein [Pseudomonadota bacterium]|nr:ankyrin repeat domain-containing protein [Pseudomonadota bacterium]
MNACCRRFRNDPPGEKGLSMSRALTRTLAVLATSISFAAGALASPTSQTTMPSTKAIFNTSGIQQRLEIAIRSNDAGAVAQLLSEDAQVNARGKHDVTPLMIAVDAQTPNAVAVLVRAGADSKSKASDGTSALHLAVENHAVKPNGHAILEMVMKGGGDPNTLRPDGDPVIMRFIYDHDLDDLRWFKALGANVDIPARSGRPLIADAAFGQNWDSVWCLIELGARYDYEHTLYPLSEALNSSYGSAPDSPLGPYKLKVWQLLKDKGIAVHPLKN